MKRPLVLPLEQVGLKDIQLRCYHRGVLGVYQEAPSDFPEFAAFLVESGIDSISVTPDSFVKTVRAIAQIEK